MNLNKNWVLAAVVAGSTVRGPLNPGTCRCRELGDLCGLERPPRHLYGRLLSAPPLRAPIGSGLLARPLFPGGRSPHLDPCDPRCPARSGGVASASGADSGS